MGDGNGEGGEGQGAARCGGDDRGATAVRKCGVRARRGGDMGGGEPHFTSSPWET